MSNRRLPTVFQSLLTVTNFGAGKKGLTTAMKCRKYKLKTDDNRTIIMRRKNNFGILSSYIQFPQTCDRFFAQNRRRLVP